MDNKVFSQIQSKLNKLQSNKDKVVDDFKKRLSEVEEQFNNASTHTTSNSSADEYVSAMESRTKAEYYIDYYKECVKRVESESIFTEEQYKDIVNDIRSEQKKAVDDSFKKIVKLLNEVFTIYSDTYSLVTDFNHLIESVDRACNKPSEIVMFNYGLYDFIRNYVSRIKHTAEINPQYGDYFRTDN